MTNTGSRQAGHRIATLCAAAVVMTTLLAIPLRSAAASRVPVMVARCVGTWPNPGDDPITVVCRAKGTNASLFRSASKKYIVIKSRGIYGAMTKVSSSGPLDEEGAPYLLGCAHEGAQTASWTWSFAPNTVEASVELGPPADDCQFYAFSTATIELWARR